MDMRDHQQHQLVAPTLNHSLVSCQQYHLLGIFTKEQASTHSNSTHLFLGPLGPSRNDVVVFVLIHHTQNAHRRLVSATKGLQQLVVLGAELLSHLACSFDQLVLHQGRILVVRLEMGLAVRRQAHQAGLLGLLPPRGAEITENISLFGLDPGLAPAGGATGLLQAAVPV